MLSLVTVEGEIICWHMPVDFDQLLPTSMANISITSKKKQVSWHVKQKS